MGTGGTPQVTSPGTNNRVDFQQPGIVRFRYSHGQGAGLPRSPVQRLNGPEREGHGLRIRVMTRPVGPSTDLARKSFTLAILTVEPRYLCNDRLVQIICCSRVLRKSDSVLGLRCTRMPARRLKRQPINSFFSRSYNQAVLPPTSCG